MKVMLQVYTYIKNYVHWFKVKNVVLYEYKKWYKKFKLRLHLQIVSVRAHR